MKVYISGKIGEVIPSEATCRKFAKVEVMLRRRGFDVLNPVGRGWQGTLRRGYEGDRWSGGGELVNGDLNFYEYALLRDLMAVAVCDAIYMMPGWLESMGARAEHAFALAIGKQVYYDDELYRDGTLRSRAYDKNRLPEVAPGIEDGERETDGEREPGGEPPGTGAEGREGAEGSGMGDEGPGMGDEGREGQKEGVEGKGVEGKGVDGV